LVELVPLVPLLELPEGFVPFVELLLLVLFTYPKLHVGQSLLISCLTSIVIHATMASRPTGMFIPNEVLVVWLACCIERVVFRVTRPLGPKNIWNQLVVLTMIDELPFRSATTSATVI